MESLTQEWLDAFKNAVVSREDLASLPFWRLALFSVPHGVDPEDPRVDFALMIIRGAVDKARKADTSPFQEASAS